MATHLLHIAGFQAGSRLRRGAFSTALFGRRAGVQPMGRVRLQAPASPYRQQPQKRFCVRF